MSNPGIANNLNVSRIADFDVFTEQVIFRYSDIVKQHKSILFGVKTKFRAYIATLYSWEPIVVSIFDLGKKRINTISFATDNSLCKNHRICC